MMLYKVVGVSATRSRWFSEASDAFAWARSLDLPGGQGQLLRYLPSEDRWFPVHWFNYWEPYYTKVEDSTPEPPACNERGATMKNDTLTLHLLKEITVDNPRYLTDEINDWVDAMERRDYIGPVDIEALDDLIAQLESIAADLRSEM